MFYLGSLCTVYVMQASYLWEQVYVMQANYLRNRCTNSPIHNQTQKFGGLCNVCVMQASYLWEQAYVKYDFGADFRQNYKLQ